MASWTGTDRRDFFRRGSESATRRAIASVVTPGRSLAAIVVLSATLRFLISLTSHVPWIIPDELIYGHLARSFAESAKFTIRDLPFSAWSFGPLYPIAISPAYLVADSPSSAYVVAKAINSVLFSAAAIPAFLLARRYLTQRAAVVVGALAVIVPSAIYSSKIMTESLSYPVFLFSILAIVRAMERPGGRNDLVAISSIGVAVLTRAQMIALVPAFASAILMLAVLERREQGEPGAFGRRVRAHRMLWSLLGLGLVGSVSVLAGRGGSISGALGAHAALFEGVNLAEMPVWVLYHLADLVLYTGIIPVIAFILVAARVLVDASPRRELRIFMLVTVAVTGSLVLLIGLFQSALHVRPGTQMPSSQHVFDRYLFYVAPLFVLALFVWISQNSQASRRITALAVVPTVLLPLTLPFSTLLYDHEWGTSSSTVSMLPWVVVSAFTGKGWLLTVVVFVFCASLGTTFLNRTSRGSWQPVRIIAAYWVTVGVMAVIASSEVADAAEAYGVGGNASWIDARVGPDADVPVIWSGYARRGEKGAFAIWEAEFFNRSVGRVLSLEEALPDRLPAQTVSFRSGALATRDGRRIQTKFVLADISVRGQAIAEDRRSGLTLYDVSGTVHAG